jgi:hypothetical protein
MANSASSAMAASGCAQRSIKHERRIMDYLAGAFDGAFLFAAVAIPYAIVWAAEKLVAWAFKDRQ